MLKRLFVSVTIAFLGVFVVMGHFAVAQEGEKSPQIPLWRKYAPTLSVQNSIYNPLEADAASPYNSYGSGEFFFPPYYSESDRMGFGLTSDDNVASLNGGWYVDWGANINPAHPGGTEYARTIFFNIHDTGTQCYPPNSPGLPAPPPLPATSLSQITPNYTGTALIQNVQKNPGALWLVGNEFDASYNGNPIKAETYAELYHYFYTTIKATDPTAKVAIGGISQPSPLRMQYLDKILSHYNTKYGQQFPTDLWSIHFYYMNEEKCEWGADIPPFATDTSKAWKLSIKDFEKGVPLDVTKLETNLRNFRQWMKNNNYQNTPLIITEYGVLATPDFGGPYTNENAATFFNKMATLFRTATDINTGYSADGKRLVQMWNWFSTYHDEFGGNLFDANGNLSIIGQAFVSQATAYHTAYADLRLFVDDYIQTETEIEIDAYAQNEGNAASKNVYTRIALIDRNTNQVVGEKIVPRGTINRRYQDSPISLAHTWKITSTHMPIVPYTLVVSVAGNGDVNAINNTYTTQFNWSSVVNMVVSETVFSIGSPYHLTDPVTTTITSTIVNRGNLASSATTADVIANGADILANDIPVPALAPGETYQIIASRYITSNDPLKILVKLNSVDNSELDVENTSLETSLLFDRVYLPMLSKK